MVCCHKQLFCPYTTTDEEKDLEIQEKIRYNKLEKVKEMKTIYFF